MTTICRLFYNKIKSKSNLWNKHLKNMWFLSFTGKLYHSWSLLECCCLIDLLKNQYEPDPSVNSIVLYMKGLVLYDCGVSVSVQAYSVCFGFCNHTRSMRATLILLLTFTKTNAFSLYRLNSHDADLWQTDWTQMCKHSGTRYLTYSCLWFCLRTVESAFGFIFEHVLTTEYGTLYCAERVNEGKKKGEGAGRMGRDTQRKWTYCLLPQFSSDELAMLLDDMLFGAISSAICVPLLPVVRVTLWLPGSKFFFSF